MKKFNKGFTLIELLIAMVIIVVMSSVFWTSLHQDYRDVLRQETERLAADIRQTRAKAVASIPETTTGEYPAGGYGIHFYHSSPHYIIFADIDNLGGYTAGTDIKLKEVYFSDDITDVLVLGSAATDFYFNFESGNQTDTNITSNISNFYVIGVVADDYRGNIRLGEDTADGFLWTNMGVSYDIIDPSSPSEGGGGGKIYVESS